ncbi:DUF2529 domain-containing protein [Bacillus sp. H-16]|uniref:DUF2529 family protein n=1 Tax=Alteribacter salitolerans TaxID=2912333 RepID=UPI001963E233|nr:DUF2529 family protein [Alteribacter salitolerans]MBM7095559.1 DUF2529 domain-containing protein [Alteribacter salitolerans]
MQKIFSTQLQGLLNKMNDTYEEAFEDGSRLIAQSLITNGKIGMFATGEMEGVLAQAIKGVDRFENLVAVEEGRLHELDEMDTVLIFSPSPNEAACCMIADSLRGRGIQTIAVFTGEKRDEDGPSLENLTDVSIDLGVKKGLVPNERGERVGQPKLLIALYAYYNLYFTTEEILAENRG